MFFILPVIIICSFRKIKAIQDPKINNSYCIISMYMLYATIFIAIWTMISNVVILGFYYKGQIFEDDSKIENILHVVDIIGKLGCNLILYLQTYEWLTMIIIIRMQK